MSIDWIGKMCLCRIQPMMKFGLVTAMADRRICFWMDSL